MNDYLWGFLIGAIVGASIMWLNIRPNQNPKPARTAAECIDRLRMERDQLRNALSRLMYWMDKAREAQEIDINVFNVVWEECSFLIKE